MIFSRNFVDVAAGYSPAATFVEFDDDKPIEKLTIQVLDSTVMLQPAETWPQTFTAPETSEIYLEMGRHSLTPVRPWSGFRFRRYNEALPARVHVIAYGAQ